MYEKKNNVSLEFMHDKFTAEYRYIKILINDNDVNFTMNDKFVNVYKYSTQNIASINN